MGRFSNVLLLTDLDGTLLDDQKRIGARTREAVRWFQEEGGSFSAATGRLHRFFWPDEQDLPLNAPAVVCNGCYIYDYRTAEAFGFRYVPRSAEAVVDDVIEKFPEACAEINSFSTTYVRGWNEVSAEHIRIMRLNPRHVSSASEATEPWVKVLFTMPEHLSERFAEYVNRVHPGYTYTFSTKVYYELMAEGVNKGSAALCLADHLGIDHKDVYAAGDHLNDLDMLRAASIAFVPENARPEALALAGHVLPDNNSDAIAALIDFLAAKY